MKNSQSQFQDPVLDELISRVAAEIPYCSSLILIGSRAVSRDAVHSNLQDYDVAAVVPTWRLPFALRKLKRIEADVSNLHKVKVTLNPLPDLRLRHPQGNYMLLKLGAEGIVIHGEDVASQASQLTPESIGQWWYFFYLASQAKRLLNTAPVYKKTSDALNYNSAKAILGCAELIVLDSGVYTSAPDHMETRLTALGRLELVELVRQASSIIRQSEVSVQDVEAFWQTSRGLLLSTLDNFSRNFLGVSYFDHSAFRDRFLRSGGRTSRIRDLQYATLSLMSKRRCDPRVFVNKRGMAERVKLALFLLLEAHPADEGFDHQIMASVRSILPGRFDVGDASVEAQWKELVRVVDYHYPSACIALGV